MLYILTEELTVNISSQTFGVKDLNNEYSYLRSADQFDGS